MIKNSSEYNCDSSFVSYKMKLTSPKIDIYSGQIKNAYLSLDCEYIPSIVVSVSYLTEYNVKKSIDIVYELTDENVERTHKELYELSCSIIDYPHNPYTLCDINDFKDLRVLVVKSVINDELNYNLLLPPEDKRELIETWY